MLDHGAGPDEPIEGLGIDESEFQPRFLESLIVLQRVFRDPRSRRRIRRVACDLAARRKARQALVCVMFEDDDDDAVEIELVGSAMGIRDAAELGTVFARAIDFDRAAYRASAKGEEAFANLRTLAEAKGAFVLLAGDCRHSSTAIEVSIFRGFAIADRLAPFIVINDQDAKSTWAFALLNELAHLLIGETGVSGGTPAAGVEQLCNDAAAAVLVDRAEVVDLRRRLSGGDGDLKVISACADQAGISHSIVAYQL